jgi:hypothetical protein
MEREDIPKWLSILNDEDYQFIRRFILASGSLKALAKEYGVSYPTVRIRLNRMIEKIKTIDSPETKDSFHLKIQLLVADGMLTLRTAKIIIEAYEKSKKRI